MFGITIIDAQISSSRKSTIRFIRMPAWLTSGVKEVKKKPNKACLNDLWVWDIPMQYISAIAKQHSG